MRKLKVPFFINYNLDYGSPLHITHFKTDEGSQTGMKRKAPGDKDCDGEEEGVEELSIRRRINFDGDSEDEEVTFNNQAHKNAKCPRNLKS